MTASSCCTMSSGWISTKLPRLSTGSPPPAASSRRGPAIMCAATSPRFPVSETHGQEIAQAFFAATRSGDASALKQLLAEDVVIYSHGGGQVLAFLNAIVGAEKVLRLFLGIRTKGYAASDLLHLGRIDGLPGFVTRETGGLIQTTALAVEDGRIAAIYIVRNPDKLGRISRLLGIQSGLH